MLAGRGESKTGTGTRRGKRRRGGGSNPRPTREQDGRHAAGPTILLRSNPAGTGLELRMRSGPAGGLLERESGRTLHRIEFRAMGCRMTAMIEGGGNSAQTRLEQVPVWFEAWETALSRFRPESELSRLNESAGESVVVSPAMWDVMRMARQAARMSQGLVTPAVLSALVAAGYDRSFDLLEDVTPAAQSPARPAAWQAIEFDAPRRAIRLPLGMRIDLGGVAKGWAATRAVKRLASIGPALVEAGGDIAVSGPRRGGTPWQIGVADPFHPDRDMASMFVSRGGVATSGQDHRRWKRGGAWNHHLIDPRTGLPAETDVLCATAWAPSLGRAEAAAKVISILGSAAGMEWADQQRDLETLVVLTDGTQLRLHAREFGQRSN
jgi:thiamine biosynthesis lipoprotein